MSQATSFSKIIAANEGHRTDVLEGHAPVGKDVDGDTVHMNADTFTLPRPERRQQTFPLGPVGDGYGDVYVVGRPSEREPGNAVDDQITGTCADEQIVTDEVIKTGKDSDGDHVSRRG